LPDVVLSSEPQSIGVKVAAAAGIAIVIYEVSSDHGNCRIIDVKPAKNVRRADRLMTLTSGEAPAVLMRTSGTTAQPKLVGLTHANVLAASDTMRVAFELTESDVCITPMPLHHVHGLIAAALSALSAGSSIHCCETFSPRSFDQALRDYAPTWLTAAPALHIAMNDYYAGQNSTPSIRTLRCFRSSSAPLPPASIARLEELYAAPLLETYGLTETASTLCSNDCLQGSASPARLDKQLART
jgi:acyl-CoA synthetase (AMP-forming)/AMP-acid ligase II